MNYHIVKLTPDGLLSIKRFHTYSEAEMLRRHYAEMYRDAWVEVVSDADLAEAEAA